MRRRQPARGQLIPVLLVVFLSGLAGGWWLRSNLASSMDALATRLPEPDDEIKPVATTASEEDAGRGAEAFVSDPIEELRRHSLRLPLDGIHVEGMKGQFAERREAGSRPHEAVDLLAPRNTPIDAVEDGKIAKLFVSRAGGNTIYQFDPSGRFCYYYAHLQRYADKLHDGQSVHRGDVLGYVGTSGNAPANTPHLHFAIFALTDQHRWWQGKPLDPYQVFKKQ